MDLSCDIVELANQIGLDSACLDELSQSIPQELDDAVRVLAIDEPAEPQRSIQALACVVEKISERHAGLKEDLAQKSTELTEAESLSQQFAQITRQAVH